MSRSVISPKLDVVFKKMFVENEDLLRDFLAKILKIPPDSITDIKITNPELTPDKVTGKFSRLDLNMKIDGKLVNLEIQVKSDKHFRGRALFYWAKLFISALRKGDEYGDLKKTITINILNFKLFDGDNFHTEIIPVEKETGKLFSDLFSIHFLELPKIGKEIDPDDGIKLWLQFIKAESEEEFEMISQTNVPIMQKAVRVIYDMSEDTETRELIREREKAMFDEASALGSARREGAANREAEIIESLKAYGMSEEQIKAALSAKK